MPLVGLVDPSHEERAESKPGRPPRWLPVEELLAQALAATTPKWSPWPYELIRAVLNEHQERDYISTSLLTGGCMRSSVIERKEPYVDTLDARYAALRGTLQHRTLERAAREVGALAEWRFWTTVDSVEISCSPDLVVWDIGWLIDWKTTENPPAYNYPYRHHTEQVQFNRFIVSNAERWADPDGQPGDIPVDPRTIIFRHLAVVYLGPKGPKTLELERTAERVSPNGRKFKAKVADIWTDKAVLKELRPRIEAFELAMDAYPSWPEGLETYPGWAGPPTWRCPGPPLCYLNCLAKRWPDNLVWES
jgi:hypothetical protein